ncbi:MAG TPA: response regulator transcription factor [Bryobacteraceae bacterium]|jgi:DNA-binding NarL/FixJ family response regulator
MKRWRILLADDHDIVVEGLRRVLDEPDFEIVGVVHDGRALIRAAEELQPDAIVADVTMPLLNGMDAARQIRQKNPDAKIVFLTMHPDVTFATEALAAGALGYVLKSSAGSSLAAAVREALDGRIYISETIAGEVARSLSARTYSGRDPRDSMTARQREVLQLLAEGRHVKEIALKLNLSPRTVEFHKYRIMAQLGVRTVADLVRYATRHGIVT